MENFILIRNLSNHYFTIKIALNIEYRFGSEAIFKIFNLIWPSNLNYFAKNKIIQLNLNQDKN